MSSSDSADSAGTSSRAVSGGSRSSFPSLLAAQTASVPTFSADFLADASDHRDWVNLLSRSAGGSCSALLPLAEIVRMRGDSHTSVYLLPAASVPLRVPITLPNGYHELVLGADFPVAAPDLASAAAVVADSVKLLSLVRGSLWKGSRSAVHYLQSLGVSRYSAHAGLQIHLPPSSFLSSLSPALALVRSHVSLSSTATVLQHRLDVTHASCRLHVRPWAAVGDRGLLSAELLHMAGGAGQQHDSDSSVRLVYTHRVSEERTEPPPQPWQPDSEQVAAARELVIDVVQSRVDSTLDWFRNLFRTPVADPPVESAAPAAAPPVPLRSTLGSLAASAAPPPWLRRLSFPSYASIGVAYLPALEALSRPAGSFRLLDSTPLPFLPSLPQHVALAVGYHAQLSPSVAVQAELTAEDERSSADVRVSWLGGSGGRTNDGSRWYVSAGIVRDSKDAASSHCHAGVGLAISW